MHTADFHARKWTKWTTSIYEITSREVYFVDNYIDAGCSLLFRFGDVFWEFKGLLSSALVLEYLWYSWSNYWSYKRRSNHSNKFKWRYFGSLRIKRECSPQMIPWPGHREHQSVLTRYSTSTWNALLARAVWPARHTKGFSAIRPGFRRFDSFSPDGSIK